MNQETFPEHLPYATSLKLETGLNFNLDELLQEILKNIQDKIQLLEKEQFKFLEKRYLDVLYRKDIPTMFKNSQDKVFIGKIIGISKNGNLLIELEDESTKEFGIKEVRLL